MPEKKRPRLSLVKPQKSELLPAVVRSVFFIVILMYLEFCFQLFSGLLSARIVWPLLFSLPMGVLLAMLTSLFPRRANRILGLLFVIALCIFFFAQLVYYYIFGTCLSLSQFNMGGDAITSFWRELLIAIGEIWYQLLLMLLPIAAYVILLRFHKLDSMKLPGSVELVLAGALVVLYVASLIVLRAGGTGVYSAYDIYHIDTASTDLSVEVLGVMTTARLEVKFMVFKSGTAELQAAQTTEAGDGDKTATVETEYNVLEIPFDYINQTETDEDLQQLNQYFFSVDGTRKNAYTGYFEGKNLILLCCESFSPAAIQEELTPTLYQLSHQGFVFNNFYSPWHSNTTNGEYTLCMGLFPDTSRGKDDGSFKASADNYLPFCLGHMFNSIGVHSCGYHNYKGSYYTRELTHPNMGYDCKFAQAGMVFTNSWPSSDLEMMEQSIGDYINDEQFHAYYMTFSGHYRYDYASNGMVRLNWADVAQLDYSNTARSYLSCNLELEYALQYLIQQLKANGQYENTVIALTADHHPYGLTNEEYSELMGHPVDETFEAFRNTFILWTPGMKTVEVDAPCCSVDILPTLLNLFGFDYDSRLLIGRDILADTDHTAILSDGSFITDQVMFDAANNTATWLVDEETLPEGFLEAMIIDVRNRFTVSKLILDTDYYASIESYIDGGLTTETSHVQGYSEE